LAFDVQHELALVLFALEQKFLGKGLVRVRDEHNVNGGALACQKHAAERVNRKVLYFLFLFISCGCLDSLGCRVIEPPFTIDLSKILKTDFDSLSCVHCDTIEVHVVI